jgi:NADH-quinone oxidoreductase subunit C
MSVMPTDIESRLTAAASAGIHYGQTTDAKGVVTAWCRLAASEDLLAVASLLKTMGTRLSTITVFQPKAPPEPPKAKEGEIPAPVPTFFGGVIQDGKTYEIDYHFDIDGDTLTITAHVPTGGQIDSLTPLYRAADWPEREAMEMYSLVVRNHPNPQRLFLDPSIDNAAFERLIPYSTLVNSAASKSLWEKIMAQTGPKS